MVAVALVAAGTIDPACDVPVFRYALEHWPAEDYELLVYDPGGPGVGGGGVVDALGRRVGPSANIRIRGATAADGAGPRVDGRSPWAVLRYPASEGAGGEVWSGPLEGFAIERWVDSPARREIARRILSGESAVWVFLESGDRREDEAAVSVLESCLRRMERTLVLPVPAWGASSPPVHLAFSILRVSRADPVEEALVLMLLRREGGLEALRAPMAIPVFGRGRKLDALVGAGITGENVAEYCAFLAGPCSCRVKLQNPGVDLLFSADWGGGAGEGSQGGGLSDSAGHAPAPVRPLR